MVVKRSRARLHGDVGRQKRSHHEDAEEAAAVTLLNEMPAELPRLLKSPTRLQIGLWIVERHGVLVPADVVGCPSWVGMGRVIYTYYS